MERHDRAQDFLQYIAANEDALKCALRKNVTYREDIFDDVFQDAVLRVYDVIQSGRSKVRDFRRYFFRAARCVYMDRDNDDRKQQARSDREWLANHDAEHDSLQPEKQRDSQEKALTCLLLLLIETFGRDTTELFITHKLQGRRGCFRRFAGRYAVNERQVSKLMREIGKFLKTDPRAIAIRKRLTDNADD